MNTEEYLKGITCIIADDSPPQRDRNTAVALKYGMIPLAVVTNGVEAIDAATKFKPMVCLLDIMMKGKTGLEAAREIQKRGIPTKVIIVTSTGQKEVLDEIALVSSGSLIKPFPDDWFLQKVFSIVNPREADAPQMNDDG